MAVDAYGPSSRPNDQRHRAAPMTPTTFQDRIAAPVDAVVIGSRRVREWQSFTCKELKTFFNE